MSRMVNVEGVVAPGFEAVKEAFERNFSERGEVGASVAIYLDGEPVVDLWGGLADPAAETPWTEDTLVLIFSATKGASATLANLLAERGELDLDLPVASYWPEFAAAGKEKVTTRMILAHQSGLPVLEAELSLEELLDGSSAPAALAEQAPIWEPGTAHGYHGLTFGWLLSEIVLRATGKPFGRQFAESIADPLEMDFYIGCPTSEQVRVATPVNPGPPDPAALDAISDPQIREQVERAGAEMMDPGSVFARSLNPCSVLPTPEAEVYSDPRLRSSEQPAVSAIANARSLARMYAACIGEVDGVRLLSESALVAATAEQSGGPDSVFFVPVRYATGYMLRSPVCEMLSESSFGHVGAGGALGFADTEAGVAFGYAQSQIGTGMVGDPRTEGLIAALEASL